MNSAILMRVRHIYSVLFRLSLFKKDHCDSAVDRISENIFLLLEPGCGILTDTIVFGFEKISGSNKNK